VAEAVSRLPWLSPGATSLLALARSPTAESWDTVRNDPGALLLAIRCSPHYRAHSTKPFFPALLSNPLILEEALHRLDAPSTSWVDWNLSGARTVLQAALRYAHTSHMLAEQSGTCDPDRAWTAGLLAPLGWFGVCVEIEAVGACLSDPDFGHDPVAVQQRLWGLDAAALGRRLARRWQLPNWLAAVVEHLGLPADVASRFGAEPELFRVVQQAVALVEQSNIANCKLHIATCKLDDPVPQVAPRHVPSEFSTWQNPASIPFLKDLLRLAAENLRLRGQPLLDELEGDVDALHTALEEQRAAEAERLQALKLGALAEFAAGAGHEINNPLAVISGQAQYLLKKVASGQWPVLGEPAAFAAGSGPHHQAANAAGSPTTDPCPLTTSLETIVAQAHRIHQILRDVMQFARPPQPALETVDLAVLVRQIVTSLEELAGQRQVRLIGPNSDPPIYGAVDPAQIRVALSCLLRNAIEAAPSGPDGGGWASIRLHAAAEHVEIVVEDNGPGPSLPQRDHLFDPFFSGRPAGRGRGLGLPTAWRMARQHGGDVTFTRPAEGPTRFVLTLPCRHAAVGDRLSA
jgi:signal transduction histidine kinase